MDVATRFSNARARTGSYRDMDGNAMPDDSGGESESNLIRRKFARTTTDPEPTFRKPSLPASASRPLPPQHSMSATAASTRPVLERAPSITKESPRRRSTLRENMRVPSGPREYPGSPGKQRQASLNTTYITDGTNTQPAPDSPGQAWRSTARAFQRTNADAYFFNASGKNSSHARLNSFGRNAMGDTQFRNISTDNLITDVSPTATPPRPTIGSRKASGGSGLVELDFLPDVNFDDFQTSIKNYDGTSPLLSDFPAVDGGRIIPRDSYEGMARPTLSSSVKVQPQSSNGTDGMSRTQSFRQRLAGARQASGGLQQKDRSSSTVKDSFKNRRQSSLATQSSVATASGVPGGPAAAAAAKPPRKSIGPGILSTLGKNSNNSQQPTVPLSSDVTSLKPSIVRNASLSKTSRRSIIQPSTSTLSGASETNARISTLQATTQSRQNKVKSLQPPPRSDGGGSDPNTPSKSSSNGPRAGGQRAHTPSSSGNRRQSMAASGRASGLGARTISPTDARRLKRISMMQPPPMPSGPTPADEMPNPMNSLTYASAAASIFPTSAQTTITAPSKPVELPRLAQPSPSLIPRKTSSATPSSARASPEASARQPFIGGPTLSSKSSYQSLFDRSGNGNTSRLPTPKPRNNASSAAGFASNASASSSRDALGDSNAWNADEDTEEFFDVPPVPAIPKAYESPRDAEQPAFFSSSMKSSQHSMFAFSADPMLGDSSRFGEIGGLPTPRFLPTPRTSLDVPAETPRKRSGEMTRPAHRRTNTLERVNANNSLSSAGVTAAAASAVVQPGPPKIVTRAQPDPNGRRNVNLQPLRLPPLNLRSLDTRNFQNNNASGGLSAGQPRPSQEVDQRDDFMSFTTPEPRRAMAKTPSTPMTASKATFFSRSKSHEDSQAGKALRSSSSHYALRDVLGMDENGNHLNLTTKWYNWGDDSDPENYMQGGVPVPGRQQPQHGRNAITPFASGSLPKNSGEYVRNAGLRGRLSGEYPANSGSGTEDEYTVAMSGQEGGQSKPRTRAQTNTTINSIKSGLSMEMSLDSPSAPSEADSKTEKKDGGGLRRKLSLGWRRTSSKAATHGEDKASPKDEERQRSRLQKRNAKHDANNTGSKGINEMPPPKLPASATWSGDVASLPSSARPSLDTDPRAWNKRKSQVPTSISSVSLGDSSEQPQQQQSATSGATGGVKTRSLHSEQPTPVTHSSSSNGARASSWGNLGTTLRPGAKPAGPQGPRHRLTSSTISALLKDKDDLTADDEMQRLSRKRKDVDTAAKESEELRKRAVARSPVTAEHVLHDRSLTGGSALNVFERGEVVDYEMDGIYFTGTKSARKIIGSLASSSNPSSNSGSGAKDNASANGNNFGYDDERGDYNIILGDHLAYRYEVVDVLGKGSFGQVVRCVDHKDGGVVAVKIIRNKKRFHQQALVEVGILGRLRDWDPDGSHATLSITSSFYFRSHLCIVTPCLSINLYELIRAHNFAGFSLPLIRRFARQLLACLVLLQNKRIIHCDLKPENILLCEARKADVRVIDFGSSCREEEKVYTYIQSRFYRSPEVILGSSYGLGIDMWSLGCILAELWTGYPIFPGENEQEQLACIMEIFGPPDRHLVDRCTRKKLFFDSVGKPRVTVSSKGRRRRPSSKTLQQALKTEDEAFVDFVSRCLRWDPDRRLKPSEAVSHPFVTNQPFHQRLGIPDEARRAARIRSTAAVPSTSAANGQSIPSPVKRAAVSSSGNAFGAQSAATPARDRTRPLPETPQTALRNGVPAPATANQIPGSPIKTANNNRRYSTVIAGAAAMAGSKRASNGAVLAAGVPPGPGASQQHPQRGASGNLAQMAASASMGAAAGQNTISSARWRS